MWGGLEARRQRHFGIRPDDSEALVAVVTKAATDGAAADHLSESVAAWTLDDLIRILGNA